MVKQEYFSKEKGSNGKKILKKEKNATIAKKYIEGKSIRSFDILD